MAAMGLTGGRNSISGPAKFNFFPMSVAVRLATNYEKISI